MKPVVLLLALVPTAVGAKEPPGEIYRIEPEQPAAFAPVYANLQLEHVCETVREVRFFDGKLTVVIGPTNLCFLPLYCYEWDCRFRISLGRLPAGHYPLEVLREGVAVPQRTEFKTLIVNEADAAGQLGIYRDLSGMWWSPEHPGEVLTVEEIHSKLRTMTWNTFGAGGKPEVFVATMSDDRGRGDLHRIVGGNAAGAVLEAAGQISLSQTAHDRMEMTVRRPDGLELSYDLQRLR